MTQLGNVVRVTKSLFFVSLDFISGGNNKQRRRQGMESATY